MNGQRLGLVGLGCLMIVAAGCKTEVDGGGGGSGQGAFGGTGGVGFAGTGVAGQGVAGTGVAGTGVAGTGAAGTGVAGTGAAGTGAAGTGAAGTGAAGTGAAGTGAAGTGAAGTGAAGTASVDPAVQACIDTAATNGSTGACTECGCMKCTELADACTDELCRNVVSCGRENACKGTECYCGVGVDTLTCLAAPTGPCKQQIVDASGLLGGPNCGSVDSCALALQSLTDAANPLTVARELGKCTQGQDFKAATALTAEVPEVIGMCATECTM